MAALPMGGRPRLRAQGVPCGDADLAFPPGFASEKSFLGAMDGGEMWTAGARANVVIRIPGSGWRGEGEGIEGLCGHGLPPKGAAKPWSV